MIASFLTVCRSHSFLDPGSRVEAASTEAAVAASMAEAAVEGLA